MDSNHPPESSKDSLLERLNRHRVLTALFLVSTIAGALVGAFQLPDDIALIRRVLGGAISGAGVVFLMTATRMMH
jgi:hypothetical protein